MRIDPRTPRTGAALGLLLAAFTLACSGGSSTAAGGTEAVGQFQALNVNVSNGDVWEINRPILIEFNNPVDPSSISFSSIIIRPVSPEVQGNPVTGTFEILAGSQGKIVVFTPACPTNEANDNGAFVPGGWTYELVLPTEGTFGSSVLRDTSGTQLSVGLVRTFVTPTPPAEQLFIDTVIGAPQVVDVSFPTGLNLFSQPDPVVAVRFNQAIDSSPDNLSTDNIKLLYANAPIGEAGDTSYLDTNRVPGELLLASNCDTEGALVYFLVTGILPPNRNLKLVVESTFQDLGGETNTFDQEIVGTTPTLADFYGDPGVDEEDVVYDEFLDSFSTADFIDPDAELPLPPATIDVGAGAVEAAFEFPGSQASPDQDFLVGSGIVMVVNTDGTQILTDSSGRNHTVEDGVLVVDDLTVEAGSTLKAEGINPFIIYASGEVNIQGRIDVSGDDARPPQALDSPQIPEPGAKGQAGGGDGGTSSWVTDAETLRGEAGDGPFGLEGQGGGGGEGSVNTIWAYSAFGGSDTVDVVIQHFLAGGGAGGNFALTLPESVLFDEWSGSDLPAHFDGPGPDYDPDVHEKFQDFAEVEAYFVGAGDGIRGSSYGTDRVEPPNTSSATLYNGAFGMEDLLRDTTDDDETRGFDPPWEASKTNPVFKFGNVPSGPDQGFTNESIFQDGDLSNDFWGRRLNPDGTVTEGELLGPWAGYGGGASGDCSVVVRFDNDLDSFLDPISDFFPDPNFPGGTTRLYLKGAPGGGGGGQLQIMAIGAIILGAEAEIHADGGSGAPGESIWFSYNQVSGSGGGSGGHIILHSATGLDLTALDIGAPGDVIPDDLNDDYVITAIGGRRGWAGSSLNDNEPDAPEGDYNGNGIFMVGAGGHGANGIIQIHVPNPVTDIAWDPDVHDDIVAYIDPEDDGLVDNDRLEEVLDVISAPAAVSLIPFYAAQTMFQSTWIDTGLAELHDPANGTAGDYPDYADAALRFLGISTTPGSEGEVLRSGSLVAQGADLMGGSTSVVTFSAYQVVIPDASTLVEPGVDFSPFFLNPNLLIGYDLFPDDSAATGFEITAASYNAVTDVLTLDTRVGDGSMLFALNGNNPNWVLRQRFFRIDTTDQKDRLPATASVKFEFQGADASTVPGEENQPGTPTAWTTDLADLEGMRFFRYRVTFDINANESGVSTSSERPALRYVKIPIAW